jgi:hypothetical protein
LGSLEGNFSYALMGQSHLMLYPYITLFRGLILSEFADKPLRDTFYSSNNLSGLTILDPFMGGGTEEQLQIADFGLRINCRIDNIRASRILKKDVISVL